ncbi:MAG: YciI family protein, partial [Stellaceae bacterium]
MKYMLLIYDEPAAYEGEAGRKLMSEMIAGHMRLGEDLRSAGVIYSGHQLQPASVATTVRNEGSARTLHDGPFAETKEQLGGYYLIDVADFDAAIAWARRIPMRGSGGVEVRPIVERRQE